MQTNYGLVDNVPKLHNIHENLIELESDSTLNFEKIKKFGYCIFNTTLSSLEKEIEKFFRVIPQNRTGITHMPVTPIKGEENLIYTREEQPFHCDNAHSGDPPAFICLFCENRSRYGGETVIKELSHRFFTNKTSPLFLEEVEYIKGANSFRVKILEEVGNNIYSTYSPFCDFYQLNSREQFLALENFHQILEHAPTFAYKLNSNEAIILDNRRFLHGRTKFAGNRKIIRLWLEVK